MKSTQCDRIKSGASDSVAAVTTQAVGIRAVQRIIDTALKSAGTTLASACKFNGEIVWDPEGAVPEGGVR